MTLSAGGGKRGETVDFDNDLSRKDLLQMAKDAGLLSKLPCNLMKSLIINTSSLSLSPLPPQVLPALLSPFSLSEPQNLCRSVTLCQAPPPRTIQRMSNRMLVELHVVGKAKVAQKSLLVLQRVVTFKEQAAGREKDLMDLLMDKDLRRRASRGGLTILPRSDSANMFAVLERGGRMAR